MMEQISKEKVDAVLERARNELLVATIPVVDDNNCVAVFGTSYYPLVSRLAIKHGLEGVSVGQLETCALGSGTTPVADTCQGDSGGPLFAYNGVCAG